jgi:hypothetical protein
MLDGRRSRLVPASSSRPGRAPARRCQLDHAHVVSHRFQALYFDVVGLRTFSCEW